MTAYLRTQLGNLVRAAMLLALLGVARTAAAAGPTKDQCIDANTQAQNARRDGKLLSARDALHVCISESCPKIVRTDCAKRLDELDTSLPSIIFEAKSGAGQDLSEVLVTVDGKPFVDHLDGAAIDIDPGEHEFNFQTADEPTLTLKFVLHEGERGRHEAITLGSPPPPPEPVHSPPPQSAAPPPSASSKRKLLALGLGATGLVGIGLGTAFGLTASAHWSDSKNECSSSSSCIDHPGAVSDRATAVNSATVSTAAFIAGGALLAAGSVLFVIDWRKHREQNAELRVTPIATPSGGGLWLTGAL